MAASKSEARRVAHQKKTDVVTLPKEELDELVKRVAALEKRQQVLIDGLQWSADQVRTSFGFGAFFARVLDAVVERVKK